MLLASKVPLELEGTETIAILHVVCRITDRCLNGSVIVLSEDFGQVPVITLTDVVLPVRCQLAARDLSEAFVKDCLDCLCLAHDLIVSSLGILSTS